MEKDDLEAGLEALACLLDLAHDTRETIFFHSEDPVEAMKLVFNERVALLWRITLDRRGFDAFAERAAGDLVRWESTFGWTVTGFGATAEREERLATVLTGMLKGADAWASFARHYRKALDACASPPAAPPPGRGGTSHSTQDEAQRRARRARERRGQDLLTLHLTLITCLCGSDDDALLDGIISHPALDGPYHTYAKARLAQRRGDLAQARSLAAKAMQVLPGWTVLADFAVAIGASLPPRAEEIRRQRQG